MLKGVEQIYHNDLSSSKDFADAKVVCGKCGFLARLLASHDYSAMNGVAEFLCLLHWRPSQRGFFSPAPDIDAAWHSAILNTESIRRYVQNASVTSSTPPQHCYRG